MTELIITSGASCSGKSSAYKNYPSFKLIEPDLIREEVTGNISDQSQNKLVWELAYQRAYDALVQGQSVYFSSTMLSVHNINSIMKEVGKVADKVKLLVFMDSANLPLIRSRLEKDLKNGVNRSNTTQVIEKQHEAFMKLINDPNFKKIEGVEIEYFKGV